MFRFILSVVIWGTIGLFVRHIELTSASLALARGVLGTLFLLAVIACCRKNAFFGISRKTVIGLMVSGVAIGTNWILFFEALRNTSVAVASVCYYLAPALVALASPFILKEKLHPVTALCVAGCFLGLAILVNAQTSSSGNHHWIGIVYGVLAAVLYAFVVLNNKRMPAVDSFASTAIQIGGATVALLPYVLFTVPMSAWNCPMSTWWLVIVVGLVHTGLAFLLWFSAMPNIKAASIAVLSYIDPIVSVAISVLVLNEPLSLTGYAGAALVLGSMMLSELLRIHRSKQS